MIFVDQLKQLFPNLDDSDIEALLKHQVQKFQSNLAKEGIRNKENSMLLVEDKRLEDKLLEDVEVYVFLVKDFDNTRKWALHH
jgi:hypothetical protein